MDSVIRDLQLDPAAASDEAMDRAADSLREKGFRGILLIAPPKVGLDASPGLPLAGFDAHVSTERVGISFDYSAILVATRLESNETFAGTLLRVRDDEGPPPRDVPPYVAEVMGRFRADARERIEDLPWRPGTLSLAVLLFDKRSNQVRVELSPGAAVESDPAVAEYLATRRGPEPPPDAIFPAPPAAKADGSAPGYPRYQPEAGTPAVPAEPGVALAVERVAMYKAGEKCILRGGFRLPILRRNVVPRSSGGRPLVQVGDTAATAVVPVSLVVVGNLMVGAVVIPLKVPTCDHVDPATGKTVATGTFNIDLFALKSMPKTPQTYTIWAVSGEILGGPATVAFVNPGMLKD